MKVAFIPAIKLKRQFCGSEATLQVRQWSISFQRHVSGSQDIDNILKWRNRGYGILLLRMPPENPTGGARNDSRYDSPGDEYFARLGETDCMKETAFNAAVQACGLTCSHSGITCVKDYGNWYYNQIVNDCTLWCAVIFMTRYWHSCLRLKGCSSLSCRYLPAKTEYTPVLLGIVIPDSGLNLNFNVFHW